ncbi:MAG: selenite/tellurite reduction operon c-type cytochrome lipoprotein ExtS [Desulfuromonadaceae bacterium]|nr:selenite/tellurite reduction operon c-type cytochrome lipoprotein ExtS [Desulfuromonadaceae bacterium]
MGFKRFCLILLGLVFWVQSAAAQQCGTCHSTTCPATEVRQQWNATQLQQCDMCHRGNPLTSRKNLAHAGMVLPRHSWYVQPHSAVVEAGEGALKTFACRRCHVTGEKGNDLATNLDAVAPARSSLELEKAVRDPAVFMPLFPLSDKKLASILTRIYSGALNAPPSETSRPLVVYFTHAAQEEDPFTRHCGGCHRMLSHKYGGLGTDIIGPNLSGMGTEFYPATARDDKAWTRDNLKDWIKNPRKIRPLTTMPPQKIKEDDVKQVLDIVWPLNSEEK